jgi:hypothetical protein
MGLATSEKLDNPGTGLEILLHVIKPSFPDISNIVRGLSNVWIALLWLHTKKYLA